MYLCALRHIVHIHYIYIREQQQSFIMHDILRLCTGVLHVWLFNHLVFETLGAVDGRAESFRSRSEEENGEARRYLSVEVYLHPITPSHKTLCRRIFLQQPLRPELSSSRSPG